MSLIRRLKSRFLPTMIRRARIAVSEDYWYHYYVEYYKGYRIDRFSTIYLYGIYVGTADPETIPKSPPDPNFDYNDWVYYSELHQARAGIDNWVMNPIYVQPYPDVTWATHVDPGWEIYQEPAGVMRYFALDKATGDQVGTYWMPEDLQEFLDWLCETQVPAGQIDSLQGIPITFYPEKTVSPYPTLYHVYEATVAAHTKRFDNWRLEDCKAWIEIELTKPKETNLTISAPEKAYPITSFTISGVLKYEYYGEAGWEWLPLSGMAIKLSYNGISLGSATTGSDGSYSKSVTIEETGTFTLEAYFEGTSGYVASIAKTSVGVGVERPTREIIPKNVVEKYEELEGLGFPVKWIIPNRSFVIEGGTLRYTGLKLGNKTYLTKWLLARDQ